MPTGYTAGVQDGSITSLRQYALNCARAFGACITMRDDGGAGEAIPEAFKPSTYNLDRLREERARRAEIEAMTDAECESQADLAHADAIDAYNARSALKVLQKQRYETMLANVRAWAPPTNEHVELRTFMLKQLSESIDFDCNDRYDNPPTRSTSWRAEQLAQLDRHIAYSIEEQAKEVERTNSRNAWVKALRDSLPVEASA